MPLRVGISDWGTAPTAIRDMIDIVLRRFRRDIQFVPQDVWKTPNGSWYDALIDGDIDLVKDLWPATTLRTDIMNFSYPFFMAKPVLTYHLTVQDHEMLKGVPWNQNLSQYVKVFGLKYAGLVGLMILLLVAAMTTIASIHSNDLTVWQWLTHFLLQQTTSRLFLSSSRAVKIVLLVSGILTIHSIQIYQGLLLSDLLTVPMAPVPVFTVQDLTNYLKARQNDFFRTNSARVNLQSTESTFAEYFLFENYYNDSITIAFREALVNNPPIFTDTETRRDESGRPVFNVYSGVFEAISQVSPNYCDFVVIPMKLELQYPMAIPISAKIDAKTLTAINAGLLENIERVNEMKTAYEEYNLRTYQNCQTKLFSYRQAKPGSALGLDRLTGTFLFTGVGCALALVTLFAEELCNCWIQYRMKRMNADLATHFQY